VVAANKPYPLENEKAPVCPANRGFLMLATSKKKNQAAARGFRFDNDPAQRFLSAKRAAFLKAPPPWARGWGGDLTLGETANKASRYFVGRRNTLVVPGLSQLHHQPENDYLVLKSRILFQNYPALKRAA
jgi:hypothetical protein